MHLSDSSCRFFMHRKRWKLEAADYLLQPASYAGVESSILRVSERIREEQLVRSYSSVGKDALREAIGFRRNILREFLQGVQMSAQEAARKAGVFGFPVRPIPGAVVSGFRFSGGRGSPGNTAC